MRLINLFDDNNLDRCVDTITFSHTYCDTAKSYIANKLSIIYDVI